VNNYVPKGLNAKTQAQKEQEKQKEKEKDCSIDYYFVFSKKNNKN